MIMKSNRRKAMIINNINESNVVKNNENDSGINGSNNEIVYY